MHEAVGLRSFLGALLGLSARQYELLRTLRPRHQFHFHAVFDRAANPLFPPSVLRSDATGYRGSCHDVFALTRTHIGQVFLAGDAAIHSPRSACTRRAWLPFSPRSLPASSSRDDCPRIPRSPTATLLPALPPSRYTPANNPAVDGRANGHASPWDCVCILPRNTCSSHRTATAHTTVQTTRPRVPSSKLLQRAFLRQQQIHARIQPIGVHFVPRHAQQVLQRRVAIPGPPDGEVRSAAGKTSPPPGPPPPEPTAPLRDLSATTSPATRRRSSSSRHKPSREPDVAKSRGRFSRRTLRGNIVADSGIASGSLGGSNKLGDGLGLP